jgi:hypothetical protein
LPRRHSGHNFASAKAAAALAQAAAYESAVEAQQQAAAAAAGGGGGGNMRLKSQRVSTSIGHVPPPGSGASHGAGAVPARVSPTPQPASSRPGSASAGEAAKAAPHGSQAPSVAVPAAAAGGAL